MADLTLAALTAQLFTGLVLGMILVLLAVGLSLIFGRMTWGKIGLTLDPPPALAGAVNLGFSAFPKYRLFVIAVTVLVLFALWLFLERTNVGLIIRAGSRDSLMVRAL